MDEQRLEAYLTMLLENQQNSKKKIKDRIDAISKFYREISVEDIDDIFITDYVDDKTSSEPEIIYDNLWLFSKHYWLEAKQFMTKHDCNIICADVKILYINLKKKEYDFREAKVYSSDNPEYYSRMAVYVHFDIDLDVTLKASSRNCESLRDIFRKYFMKNLIK